VRWRPLVSGSPTYRPKATTLKVTRVRVLFQLLLNEPKIQKAGAFNRAKKETKAPGRAITGAEPKVTRHNH
jgi:hypothetical protein